MSRPSRRHVAVMWPAVWLLVFGLDASLQGNGRGHQMGALGLGLLFAVLVVGELVAVSRDSED